jgi:DNA-binding NarL/FixJ family response regulator
MIIRILLIGEQILVREGFRLIIQSNSEFEVVGEARNPAEAIELIGREQPDIVLLDSTSASDAICALIRNLLEAAASLRVIILSDTNDSKFYREAISCGARGIVFKQESSQILIRAIRRVYEGEIWVERSITSELLTESLAILRNSKVDPNAIKTATLTQREREVIILVAEGLKNKRIAESLFITEATVSHHLTSIFSKLGVSDRLQLMVYAYRNGLTKPKP